VCRVRVRSPACCDMWAQDIHTCARLCMSCIASSDHAPTATASTAAAAIKEHIRQPPSTARSGQAHQQLPIITDGSEGEEHGSRHETAFAATPSMRVLSYEILNTQRIPTNPL